MNNPLIIVGASARAAAQSAVRAGFSPWCVDHFADADLVLAGPARRAARYPHDLAEVLHDAPGGPWMYTGALENHPQIVGQIAAARALWGTSAATLEAVRDPWRLANLLRRNGFLAPHLSLSHDELPVDGGWLVKRRRSAGGFHVRRWDGDLHHERPETHYFQQYIAGTPCSALFVGAGGKAVLLGATQQLIGEAWAGATGFQYVGSIGPVNLDAAETATLQRLGTALCDAFGLRGLFGVDFVRNAAGLWPIEVNPRYTASVEILERATGVRAIAWHAAACRNGMPPPQNDSAPTAQGHCGKAVLFAPAAAQATRGPCERLLAMNQGQAWPEVADIPSPGSQLQSGAPVATVFAAAATARETLALLRERIGALRQLLFPDGASGIE